MVRMRHVLWSNIRDFLKPGKCTSDIIHAHMLHAQSNGSTSDDTRILNDSLNYEQMNQLQFAF